MYPRRKKRIYLAEKNLYERAFHHIITQIAAAKTWIVREKSILEIPVRKTAPGQL